MLNFELVTRWKLVNELIVDFFTPSTKLSGLIKDQASNLASLVAYPLLEEVARNISNAWDEEGRLLKEIPSDFGLTKKNSRDKIRKASYKEGHRIVLLSHKLRIMMTQLSQGLQKALDSLDKRMRISFIEGNTQELTPLFERLEYHRDRWLHGRKFEGWEAIFISLLLCMLYFRPTDNEISNHEKQIRN